MSDSFKVKNPSIIIQSAANSGRKQGQTQAKPAAFTVTPFTQAGGSYYAKKAAFAEEFPKFTLRQNGQDSFRPARQESQSPASNLTGVLAGKKSVN